MYNVGGVQIICCTYVVVWMGKQAIVIWNGGRVIACGLGSVIRSVCLLYLLDGFLLK